jgi:hypothetical protein
MQFYFSHDGSYGSMSKTSLIDTSSWTQEQWDEIETCSDSERLELAKKFDEMNKKS